jgi:flagellar biosynthesis/type III secretory pathway protein FliH
MSSSTRSSPVPLALESFPRKKAAAAPAVRPAVPGRRRDEARAAGGAGREVSADEASLRDLRERMAAEHALEVERLTAEHARQIAALEAGFSEDLERTGAAMHDALASVAKKKADYERDMEQWIVRIALAAAAHIVGRQITAAPEEILDVVRAAIRAADAPTGPLRVRVAEADLEALATAFAEDERIVVSGDSGLLRGSCVIETPERIVDASLAGLLEAMEREVTRG